MTGKESKTFCLHPFTGVATREDGAVKVCCRSQPIGWIQDDSLEHIWNGHHIKGEIPEARINLYPNALDSLREDYTMPFEFPTMEIKLNNLCNLRCRMCNPLDSTSWTDWDEVKPFYAKEGNYLVKTVDRFVSKPGKYIGPFDDTDNWWASFEKLLPHFRRVEFAGGEPLMIREHKLFLEEIIRQGYADKILIRYNTNGLLIDEEIIELWKKFKKVKVGFSIDAVSDRNYYIRYPSDWDTIERNLHRLDNTPDNIQVSIDTAIQILYIKNLPELAKWKVRQKFKRGRGDWTNR